MRALHISEGQYRKGKYLVPHLDVSQCIYSVTTYARGIYYCRKEGDRYKEEDRERENEREGERAKGRERESKRMRWNKDGNLQYNIRQRL